MAGVEDYSVIPASNTGEFPENQAPSTVNDGGRQTQADIAQWHERLSDAITVGGTADALTATFSVAHTAHKDGRTVIVKFASDNATTTPTFQLDSLTAYTITKNGGDALAAGDCKAGAYGILKYVATGTRWELLNPGTGVLAGKDTIDALTYVTGTWALIDSWTPTATASHDFTWDETLYRQIKVVFDNVTLASSTNILARVGYSNGATIYSGGGYCYAYDYFNNVTYNAIASAVSQTSFVLTGALSSHSSGSFSCELNLHLPSVTTAYPGVDWVSNFDSSGAGNRIGVRGFGHVAGAASLPSVVDTLQVLTGTGNFGATGSIKVYGLK